MSLPLLTYENENLCFKEENLEQVLNHESIGNKSIAIVSIAGPYRMGKSFFLNLIHKYYRTEGWDKNWLEDFDSGKDCTIKWSPGVTGDTPGIVILEKPLIVQKSDETEKQIAVVLLDTQGNFENGGEKKDSLAIFALSVLFSSLQIFNVSKQIQSSDMEYLECFVEFTVAAEKHHDANHQIERLKMTDGKYFQDLMFLVRDWPHAFEFPYGSQGGNEYLKRLDEQSMHYRNIKNTFARSWCYLMPQPGLQVMTPASKTPYLTTKDLGDIFKEHMVKVADKYFRPDKLSTNNISSDDLIKYMKCCAKAILKGEILDFPTLKELVAEHQKAKAMEEVLHSFKKNMDKVIKDIDKEENPEWEYFDLNVDRFKDQAIKEFLSSFIFGNNTDNENVLRMKLENATLKYQIEMLKKRVKCIRQLTESWLNDSINSLKNLKPGYLYMNPDQYHKKLDELKERLVSTHAKDATEVTEQVNTAVSIINEICDEMKEKAKQRNLKVLRYGLGALSFTAVAIALPAVGAAVLVGEVTLATIGVVGGGTAVGVLGSLSFMKKKVDDLHKQDGEDNSKKESEPEDEQTKCSGDTDNNEEQSYLRTQPTEYAEDKDGDGKESTPEV